jgi:hypothetical protein
MKKPGIAFNGNSRLFHRPEGAQENLFSRPAPEWQFHY